MYACGFIAGYVTSVIIVLVDQTLVQSDCQLKRGTPICPLGADTTKCPLPQVLAIGVSELNLCGPFKAIRLFKSINSACGRALHPSSFLHASRDPTVSRPKGEDEIYSP